MNGPRIFTKDRTRILISQNPWMKPKTIFCFKTTPKARKMAKVREREREKEWKREREKESSVRQKGRKVWKKAEKKNAGRWNIQVLLHRISACPVWKSDHLFLCFCRSSKWRTTGHCSQSSLSRQCRHSLSVQRSAFGGERWGVLLPLRLTTATTSIRTRLDIEILNYRPSYSLRPIHLSLMYHISSEEKWNFLVRF